MILRLLETIAIFYVTTSYLVCGYVLMAHHPYKDIEASRTLKILSSVIFFVLAPLMVADVIFERLRGNGPGGVA